MNLNHVGIQFNFNKINGGPLYKVCVSLKANDDL